MKKIFLLATFLILFYYVQAQEGNNFPSIEGTTLTGKQITLPSEVKGRYTLIGLAYSKKSDEFLETWFQPTYAVFLDPKALFVYDVNLYFIPMVGGINQVAAKNVEKKLKEDIDKKMHDNIIFYKGNISAYKKELNLDDKNKPFFFILDDTGKIIYATSGEYTPKKMNEIEDRLADLLK